MSEAGRQLHFNVTLINGGYYPGSWRLPEARPLELADASHYQRCAQIAERGALDAIFFADSPTLGVDLRTVPTMTPLEPTILLTAVAAVTERIGLIATASTTYEEPYNLARRFASLDRISGGRAGWNIVSTASAAAAANFGPAAHPSHSERYERATEFVEVVLKLWNSWDDDVLIGDRETGLFARTERIHAIEHMGAQFEVNGPLNVPRSAQGHPILVQAGASAQGKALSARFADVIFTTQRRLAEAKDFYADVKRRVAEHGRNPDAVKVLPGLVIVLGGTEAEALARRAELEALIDLPDALAALAPVLAVKPQALALDERLPPEVVNDPEGMQGSQSLYADTVRVARAGDLTVRELIFALAGRYGHPVIAGTPEQVADHIELWFREGAADGFNLMPDVLPGGLEAFVDHVVPELRRRGIFRGDYEGATLRSHYGLSWPTGSVSGARRPWATSVPAVSVKETVQ